MKKWKCRYKQYAGAFGLPVFLFVALMALRRVEPFGDRTLLLWDAEGQYAAMLAQLRRVILGEADAFYTLTKAAGGSMAGITAYYLASPLNVLLALFPANRLTEAFGCIVLLKIGLSGLSCCYALERRRNTGMMTLMFSTAYALMGYTACYFWNIMWLDGVLLLPLIACGIDRLVRESRPFLYLISLTAALWCNYYIGYMLCLFSVLWFGFGYLQRRIAKEKTRFLRESGLFASASLLAGALAACMLLPAFFSLGLGSDMLNAAGLSLQPRFLMAELATKFFTGATSYEELRDGLPIIYVGIPVLALLGCYAVNSAVPRAQRILSAAWIGIFLLSFQVEGLYLIWHGLDAPNAMPARFSFLFSFVLIGMAYEGYGRLHEMDRELLSSRMGYMGFAVVAATCLLFSSGLPSYLAYETVVFDIICFLGACGLIVWLGTSRRRMALILLVMIEAVGLVGNGYFAMRRMEIVDGLRAQSYETWVSQRQETVDAIHCMDDGVYRVETNDWRVENDPMVFGYAGLSHYSSDFDPAFASFVDRIGLYQSHFRIQYAAGTTPVLESLFGVKYLMHNDEKSLMQLPQKYQLLWQDKDVSVWQNPYALPLAFIATNDEKVELTSDDPFENQNRLFCDLAGTNEPIFTPVEVETRAEGIKAEAYFTQQPGVRTYLCSEGWWFSLNGGDYENMGRFVGCVALPDVASETRNQLRVSMSEGYEGGGVYVSSFDEAAFERGWERLNAMTCTVESETDSHFVIHTAETKAASQLVLTLPYDAGWRAEVDGEEAVATSRYDALLAVDLPAGAHTVEWTFRPRGWKAGVWISTGAAVILIGWMTFYWLKKKRKK